MPFSLFSGLGHLFRCLPARCLFSGLLAFFWVCLLVLLSCLFWQFIRAVLERFDCLLISLFGNRNLPLFFPILKSLFEKFSPSFRESIFLAVVKSFIALIAVGLDASRIAFSKSKIKETAAAVVVGVVGIGLLFSPSLVGQERPSDEPLPSDSRSLLSPYVNSIEVHNHGSVGFSISLDVGSGWEAFGGANFCYPDPDAPDGWDTCSTESSTRSVTFRWPDSVYMLNPPEGTSTHSYNFRIQPEYGGTFDAAGTSC